MSSANHIFPNSTIVLTAIDIWHNGGMSDQPPQSSAESSPPAPRPQMAEIYRSKTVTQRIQMMFDANATMRLLIAGTLQTQHPEWNGQTIERAIAKRMLNANHGPG
jgi:hypothetical protein